jgi:hypothetical protein
VWDDLIYLFGSFSMSRMPNTTKPNTTNLIAAFLYVPIVEHKG